MTDVDLRQDAEAKVNNPDGLAVVTDLARGLIKAQRRVEELEEQVKQAKEAVVDLEERRLPEAMDAVNLKSFELGNGFSISVVPETYARIAKANLDAALEYLRKKGHGGLIKNEIIAYFGKGQDAAAKKYIVQLQKKYPDIVMDQRITVPHQTLSAWARELSKEGHVFDETEKNLFGIFIGRRAKISAPKV